MIVNENKNRIRKLIVKLRDPATKQAHRVLERISPSVDAGVCCLGAACRVAMENGLLLMVQESVTSQGALNFEGELAFLPAEVCMWYGFTYDPFLDIPVKYQGRVSADDGDLRLGKREHATTLNDYYKFTLPEIADCFEYTYVREDWKEK